MNMNSHTLKASCLSCLPISPHAELRSCPDHVHTCPEWQGYGWFIAFAFLSSGAMTGRWFWTENGRWRKDSSFRIAKEHLARLHDLCDERLEDWLAWSEENLEELQRCLEEYEVSPMYYPLSNILA